MCRRQRRCRKQRWQRRQRKQEKDGKGKDELAKGKDDLGKDKDGKGKDPRQKRPPKAKNKAQAKGRLKRGMRYCGNDKCAKAVPIGSLCVCTTAGVPGHLDDEGICCVCGKNHKDEYDVHKEKEPATDDKRKKTGETTT